MAHLNIKAPAEWEKVIENAMLSCNALAVLLTADYYKSKWTPQEIGFCLASQKRIIPILLSENPARFMNKFQATNNQDKSIE